MDARIGVDFSLGQDRSRSLDLRWMLRSLQWRLVRLDRWDVGGDGHADSLLLLGRSSSRWLLIAQRRITRL